MRNKHDLPATGRKRALLIGSQLNLAATAVDLGSMDRVLKLHGFKTRRIGETDRPATRAGILGAIDAFTQDTSTGDAVVVYYTGHGITTERNDNQNAPRTEGSDTNDRWRLQLIVPIDFEESTDGDFRGITDLELSQKFALLSEKTDNITLILDCCHSTRIARAGATVKSLNPAHYAKTLVHIESIIEDRHFRDNLYAAGNPSVVRIVAAEATEPAYEDSIQSTPGPTSFASPSSLRHLSKPSNIWLQNRYGCHGPGLCFVSRMECWPLCRLSTRALKGRPADFASKQLKTDLNWVFQFRETGLESTSFKAAIYMV